MTTASFLLSINAADNVHTSDLELEHPRNFHVGVQMDPSISLTAFSEFALRCVSTLQSASPIVYHSFFIEEAAWWYLPYVWLTGHW